jgi:hypothetical protein
MIGLFMWMGSPAAAAEDAPAEVPTVRQDKSYALVIGINDYKDPGIKDLVTAVADAESIGSVLEQDYGFEVQVLTDGKATKKNIYSALSSLRNSARLGDSVLIYFAGHGEVDDLGAYWLPHGAVAPGEDGAEAAWIPSSSIRDNLSAFRNRHVLIISDSCFAGGLISTRAPGAKPRVSEEWIKKVMAKPSRWIFTSGSNEPVADKTKVSGENSVFAFFLLNALKSMKDRPFSIQDLATRVQRNVGNNSWQTPRANAIIGSGDQGGQFVFIPTSMGDKGVAEGAVYRGPTGVSGALPAVQSTKNGRTMMLSGVATLAVAAASMGVAGWARQEYLASADPAERERLRKQNTVFGYSGIGLAVVGGGLIVGGGMSGRW